MRHPFQSIALLDDNALMRTNAPVYQIDAGIDLTNVVYERAIKVLD
jgi:hypothetical protein